MKNKSTITEDINNIESFNQLINFLSNSDTEIDFDKFSLFTNENWEKDNNTKADFSPLIENLLMQQSKLKIEKVNESDIDEVIKNTFEKFNYSINENCSIDFKSNLENFIKNDDLLILGNIKYSKSLHSMFSIIEYHKNILAEFNKVKNDNSIPLREKGIAYSSNRNVNEVITAVKNYLEPTYRLVKDDEDSEIFKEFKKILTTIDKFEETPYEVVVLLASINKDTFNYLKNEEDIKIAKTILIIKKILNASQGLIKEDFYHSMRFWTISLFPFTETQKYGFTSQQYFIDFLNDMLENIININYFKYQTYDLNVEIQQKDLFNSNSLMEKVTNSNKKKHPIFDNPLFIETVKDLLIKSLK